MEENKLIAEFMGMKPIKKDESDGIWTNTIKAHDYNVVMNLSFNNNWNWLMEVVEKIESLSKENETYSFSITKISVRVLYRGNRVVDLPINDTKIEAVYNACVDFIKWYNNKK